ncbi:hypothetical protein [Aquamicrobium soli]|uniref:Uncharacterized protein n=1 Tax=Aquamicrobium soli TaxID=1811518 RepID=A0ABV7KI31_9HYPH
MTFHSRPKTASAQTLIQMTVDAEPDKIKAAKALVDLAATNATLRDYLVQLGAKTAVGDRIRSDNAKIFRDDPQAAFGSAVPKAPLKMHEPPIISLDHKRRVRRLAPTLQLLNVILPNGVRMALAKRADIANAVDTYEPQARDMAHKANYYRTVLSRLPNGKAVKDVFDDAALTAIYNATKAADHASAA